ncbi:protein NRT1/ PTR FAMILY 5.5-like [Impatiens glandulifera]|uniref:protein NRT1/ PTR FAMILY 5.5-like n=1 Tax=Impatiens glandulifera TaxID=253017 RepID=UPI001FB1372F|nr:protein NRT1/ PTR FAMILY 5.5-like [Impatiens glandulifera]
MIPLFYKITILFPANSIAIYATWTLMIYLTSVWNLNLTYAAAIVNVFKGSVKLMAIAMKFLIDTYTGHFFMLLFTSISYCIGLCLLTISMPPVTGICSEYKPECIGKEQRKLFFAALALIAVGMSGFNVSAQKVFSIQVDGEQLISVTNELVQCCDTNTRAYIIIPILFVVITFVKLWLLQFGMASVLTLIATIMFASGICEYYEEDELNGRSENVGSPNLTTIFRVFVASTWKMLEECPVNPEELYKGKHVVGQKKHTPYLRFLDKAAIILPTASLCDQEGKKWKLCSVTEVENAKRDTYFQEQATMMNPQIWLWSFPLNSLKLIYDIFQGNNAPTDEIKFSSLKSVAFARFCVAMVVSIICCSTAAMVEFYRLGVVKRNGLIDKPDEVVPMSILWIIPQFVLLGYLDRNSQRSSYQLLVDTFGSSMKEEGYLDHVVSAISGVGIIGNAICVFLVDMITRRGGKASWFQDTLNKSRLDCYYCLLAFLSAASFGFFLLMREVCKCWEAQLEEIENQRGIKYSDTNLESQQILEVQLEEMRNQIEVKDLDTNLETLQLIGEASSSDNDQIQPFLG